MQEQKGIAGRETVESKAKQVCKSFELRVTGAIHHVEEKRVCMEEVLM